MAERGGAGPPSAAAAREPLPIDAHLPAIVRSLEAHGAVVVEAEPGAGKTTRVPPALLDAGLGGEGEVWVLEPRRIAARMAARRVAAERGEPLGQTVGYQVRFESRVSARTRLRFVTEGLLVRRLVGDPTLRGIGAVVLDELHERHLDTDLALAMLRALRAGARPDLALVAMSATMDSDAVAAFVGGEVVRVPGRTFPVEVRYAERVDERPLGERVAAALRGLLAGGSFATEGARDVLVFLPGAAEIREAARALAPTAARHDLDVVPLHGALSSAAQDRAVSPGPRPKVILATNVAETSITVPNVVAVIDSGLARVARDSRGTGLPVLRRERISRASATQRAGRAGRVRAGVCLRLYTRHDHDLRPAHDEAEIRRV